MSKIPKVILLIERSRSFGRGLLHGIIQYSNLHGPWLYYMEPEFYRQGKEKSHKWLTGLDADGVMAHTWDIDFIDSIVNLGLPAITVPRRDTISTHSTSCRKPAAYNKLVVINRKSKNKSELICAPLW